MLSRFSISKKLVISNLLYAIPITVTLSLLILGDLKAIDFGKKEVLGNDYLKPLVHAYTLVSQRKLTLQQSEVLGFKLDQHVQDLNAQIDAKLEELNHLQSRFGEDLQITASELKKRNRDSFSPESIRVSWNKLKSENGSKPGTDQELLSQLRGLVGHVGDTSNLILDPDLDSYYLMDSVLLALPQVQDRLQEMAFFTEFILSQKEVTPEQQLKAGVLAALFKTEVDRVLASTSTAFNEDEHFYGVSPTLRNNLAEHLKALEEKSGQINSVLNSITEKKEAQLNSREIRNLFQTAITGNLKFWNSSADELDVLLSKRIDSLHADMVFSVILGLFSLIVSGLFSFFIGKNLRSEMLLAVKQLQEASLRTRTSGESLVETSAQLAQSTTEQAAAIQQTTAALFEINTMVSHSSENAQKSTGVAEKSQRAAVEGQNTVRSTIEAIHSIQSANEDILKQIDRGNQQMAEIVRIITGIGEKTKVINDIVFQTKLLSFNASVEAARAGEHGKGFAVVAEEVGGLAQMSGNAAKEISEMLDASISKVRSIAEDTKTKVSQMVEIGTSRIQTGAQVAEQCGDLLSQLVSQVEEVRLMSVDISQSAKEQNTAVTEITKAMNLLDQATGVNSSASEEAAFASKDLAIQAEELESIVSRLSATVHGQGGDSGSSVKPVSDHGPVKSSIGRIPQAIKSSGAQSKLKSEAKVAA